MLTGKLEHGAKILQVEQEKPVIVGNLEHQREHPLLCRVQVEQAAEQQGTKIRNRRTHRIPVPPEHVPEHDGGRAPLRLADADGRETIAHLRRGGTGSRQTRQIALHVGEKHRHAEARKVLRQHLQRDGLAGAGRAGDQAMAVGQSRTEHHVCAGGRSSKNERVAHDDPGDRRAGSRCCMRRLASAGPFPCSSCLK